MNPTLKAKVDKYLLPFAATAATLVWQFVVGKWPQVGLLATTVGLDQATFTGLVTGGAVFVLSVVETDLEERRKRKAQAP